MRIKVTRVFTCLLPALVPAAILAFSTGPPIKRTGAAVDGGLNCTQCHNTFGGPNTDPSGSLKVEASDYAPGVKQTIRVTISHPTAQRWGFELTARPVSDQTKMAGTFATSDFVQVKCDTTPASSTPCNGALEFAEHTQPGTRIGQPNGATFEVDWTPPSAEVGDIILYAAGNAANGNSNPTGDHIYTTSVVIHPQDLCNLAKKPTLRTVVNGASFDTRLSANSMVSILGADFQDPGVKRTAGLGDFVNNAFPSRLACVAVELGGKRAPIVYVQPDQINAQVPASLAGSGPISVVVILNPGKPNEVRSDLGNVTLVNAAPAFFTFGTSKSIAALAADNSILADPSVVPDGKPAKPGDVVVLYGTGFGFTDPVYQAGEITAGQALLAPGSYTITIGGVTLTSADILYAGLAPQAISGLYQFNVRIPRTASPGAVPVTIAAGGSSTQSGATIPVVAAQ